MSLRALCKRPAFTAVALLSLALGIGANTAIFTLIQQLLLRNLPVRSPEQLVTFGDATNSGIAGGIDIGQYGLFPWYVTRQLQANPGPFQGIAAIGSFSPKVSVRLAQASGSPSDSPAQLATASLVSGNYFSVLGAHVLMGRTITPADDATPGTGAVAVASFHFWQQALSSDPGILSKTITINGTPFDGDRSHATRFRGPQARTRVGRPVGANDDAAGHSAAPFDAHPGVGPLLHERVWTSHA